MTTLSFPPLRAAVLHALAALKEAYDLDQSVLKDAPYDAEAINILEKMFAPKVITNEVIKEIRAPAKRGRPSKDTQLGEDDMETVRENLVKLMKELDGMGDPDKDKDLDTNAKIQITKTKASLVEQLLKMKERTHNVKRMSEFQTVVIGILDDLISEGDRDVFLQRIDPYRD